MIDQIALVCIYACLSFFFLSTLVHLLAKTHQGNLPLWLQGLQFVAIAAITVYYLGMLFLMLIAPQPTIIGLVTLVFLINVGLAIYYSKKDSQLLSLDLNIKSYHARLTLSVIIHLLPVFLILSITH